MPMDKLPLSLSQWCGGMVYRLRCTPRIVRSKECESPNPTSSASSLFCNSTRVNKRCSRVVSDRTRWVVTIRSAVTKVQVVEVEKEDGAMGDTVTRLPCSSFTCSPSLAPARYHNLHLTRPVNNVQCTMRQVVSISRRRSFFQSDRAHPILLNVERRSTSASGCH